MVIFGWLIIEIFDIFKCLVFGVISVYRVCRVVVLLVLLGLSKLNIFLDFILKEMFLIVMDEL